MPSPITNIGTADATSVTVRGRDLVNELIGRHTYTEVFYFLATGRMPTAQQTRVLDACLVTLMEHGFTPATGLLGTSSLPLRIGANSLGGETFIGFIDELRIYDRALSAAEIQSDMALPVQPPLVPAVPGTTPAAILLLIASLLGVAGYGMSSDRTKMT